MEGSRPQLLCLDGTTLWDKPVDHLDALSGDEQTTAKTARAKEQQRMREYMTWRNKIYYNNDKNRWKTAEEAQAIFQYYKNKPKQLVGFSIIRRIASGYLRSRNRLGLKHGGQRKDGGIGRQKPVRELQNRS